MSPSLSHRTYSKPTSFNRSISNDFGVSYTSKPPAASRTSGFSSSDHSRSSSSNLTPFESRYNSGNSRTTASLDSKPIYTSSYHDNGYNISKSSETIEERFRVLTSRATSPDSSRKSSSSGLISDTQTEKYPLTDTTRRRQLKNAFTQVEPNESEQFKSHLSTSTSRSSTADQILPKQSGFVPKTRNFRYQSKSDVEDERPRPLPQLLSGREKAKENVDDCIPRQSSFLKKIKPVEVPEKCKEPPKSIIGSTVSLKESIEKVKSWKKQLQENADYKDNDDDIEWRKKLHLGSNKDETKEQKLPLDMKNLSPEVQNLAYSDSECQKTSTKQPQKLVDKPPEKAEGISGFLRKASSYVSLPDLVESAERSRESNAEENKTFIGRLKDIDTLLDFEDASGEVQESEEPQVLLNRCTQESKF